MRSKDKYRLCVASKSRDPQMTVPYLDPALPLSTRKAALQANYGFICVCPLCTFQERISPVPPLPTDATELVGLEDKLCMHVTSQIISLDAHRPPFALKDDKLPWGNLPADLHTLLDEKYLPQLSEAFSKASHEGQYATALRSGRTLLAYYAVTYSLNYPQIGMSRTLTAATSHEFLTSAR